MSWQLILGWMQYVTAYFRFKTRKAEVGQGLVEYALILVFVSVVMVILLTVLGPGIRNIYTNIVTSINESQTQ